MGHERNVKLLRKQLANVVQDLLPGTLLSEISKEVHNKVKKDADARLDAIDTHLKTTLEGIDRRSKDTMDYVLRQIRQAQAASVPSEVAKADPANE